MAAMPLGPRVPKDEATMEFEPGDMLQQLPVGVLVCDGEGTVIWLNSMLERLFASTTAELRGVRWDALPVVAVPPGGAVRRFRLLRPPPRVPRLFECTTRTLLLNEQILQVSCFSPLREAAPAPGHRGRPSLRLVGKDGSKWQESAPSSSRLLLPKR